jgi:hypothetical protein
VQFTNAHNLSTDFSITGPQARIVANYKKQGFTESKDALSSSARRLISTGKPESTTGFQSYSYKMAHMIYEDAGRIYYKWSHTDAKFNDIYWPEEFESFLVEGINPAITYSAFHDETATGSMMRFLLFGSKTMMIHLTSLPTLELMTFGVIEMSLPL